MLPCWAWRVHGAGLALSWTCCLVGLLPAYPGRRLLLWERRRRTGWEKADGQVAWQAFCPFCTATTHCLCPSFACLLPATHYRARAFRYAWAPFTAALALPLRLRRGAARTRSTCLHCRALPPCRAYGKRAAAARRKGVAGIASGCCVPLPPVSAARLVRTPVVLRLLSAAMRRTPCRGWLRHLRCLSTTKIGALRRRRTWKRRRKTARNTGSGAHLLPCLSPPLCLHFGHLLF